jgi:chorismate mutase/prephenate dehydrogenase
MKKDLDSLRARIRSTDEQILTLIRQRLDLAREIGQVKFSSNIPVKDYKVEKDVLDRNLITGSTLGLYEPLTTDITKLLIRYAVLTQDEFQSQEKRSESTVKYRILIAGGRGRMGVWLSEFFDSFGHLVSHYDPSAAPAADRVAKKYDLVPDLAAAAAAADVIVIAAPISTTADLITSLTTLKPRGLILDICSLKSPVLAAIRTAEQAGLRIGSVHPMFGPNVDMLSGRNIVICDTGNQDVTAAATALFSGTTANLITIPLADHDRLMSYVLGLSHLINLIFSDVLTASGLAASELMQVASTTYLNQTAVARAVAAENPELYYEIQAGNNFTPELVAALKTSVESWFRDISGGDRSGFINRMQAADRFMNAGSKNS